MKVMRLSCSGFTLIETFVVILIIAVLVAVVMPKFFFMITTAKQSTTRGYLATLRSATNLYFADNTFYPYQFAKLSFTDASGNKYDSITDSAEKENNAWVPTHLSRWPPGIRIGQGSWVSSSGENHEGENDMRVMDGTPIPKSNHDWSEELIYDRTTGEIYINCNLFDRDGKHIHDW